MGGGVVEDDFKAFTGCQCKVRLTWTLPPTGAMPNVKLSLCPLHNSATELTRKLERARAAMRLFLTAVEGIESYHDVVVILSGACATEYRTALAKLEEATWEEE